MFGKLVARRNWEIFFPVSDAHTLKRLCHFYSFFLSHSRSPFLSPEIHKNFHETCKAIKIKMSLWRAGKFLWVEQCFVFFRVLQNSARQILCYFFLEFLTRLPSELQMLSREPHSKNLLTFSFEFSSLIDWVFNLCVKYFSILILTIKRAKSLFRVEKGLIKIHRFCDPRHTHTHLGLGKICWAPSSFNVSIIDFLKYLSFYRAKLVSRRFCRP